MSNYHYYFVNGICRSIKGVKEIKVDTWIHLKTEKDTWLVNPNLVNCVRIETENYEKENKH